MKKSILILGKGYLGKHFQQFLSKLSQQWSAVYTSRHPSRGQIHFDLMDPATWQNLPKELDRILWTFPPLPQDLALNFYQQHLSKHNCVIIGTTGSFEVSENHQVIAEDSPLQREDDRALSELCLQEAGAKLLLTSGIYGPERSPIAWLKKGRVGYENRHVNLIHVEDLCQFAWKSFDAEQSNFPLIASDQHSFKWTEIITFLNENYNFNFSTEPQNSKKPSKIVNAQFSAKTLGIAYRYPDLKMYFKETLREV